MTSKRDQLFPTTSIGRSQGSRLQHQSSHESLTAHPLLSSTPSAADFSPGTSGSASGSGTQRYVPYTPRQRVSPSPVTTITTGTAIHPPSPKFQQGDATSKLQLMNLKAAAQNVGLDAGSVGWAILEKLVYESEHQTNEWVEVWTAVASGKVNYPLVVSIKD